MSLRVLHVPITKKGHCLEIFVTTVNRENSLEPFLRVFFLSLGFVRDFFHCQKFLNVGPENILVGSALWLETVDKGCRTFLTESGLVFPGRLECLPYSRKKTIKTAGKRGEGIRLKFFAVLFTNFNKKCASEIVEFSRWYQLSRVLTCLQMSPSSSSALIWFSSRPFFL